MFGMIVPGISAEQIDSKFWQKLQLPEHGSDVILRSLEKIVVSFILPFSSTLGGHNIVSIPMSDSVQDQAVHVQYGVEQTNAVHATLRGERHDEQVWWFTCRTWFSKTVC